MSLNKLGLRNEVKRRATRNQSGTQFDIPVDNAVNFAISRIARETYWKVLRREKSFDTEAQYTTGSGAVTVTNGSKSVSVTGATLITDGIEIGRRVDLGGSTQSYIIKTITSETEFTVDKNFDGTSSSTQTYKIYGREKYSLPAQIDQIGLVWHEDYGYPYALNYIPEKDFFDAGEEINDGDTPTHYREWGADWVMDQPLQNGVISASSSSGSDTTQTITIFGNDSDDLPTSDTVTLNGLSSVATTVTFTTIERVVKSGTTTGKITITSDSGNVTVAKIPAGSASSDIQYRKIMLYPLPTRVFPVHVWAYKRPVPLVNDSDIHELGSDFDEAIILLATAKIKYQESQMEGDRFLRMFDDELTILKRRNSDKLDWIPNLRSPRESRSNTGRLHRFLSYSQIGGKFGPSSRI